MRWAMLISLLLLIAIITDEFTTIVKLYKTITNKIIGNVDVLDLDKPRFDRYLKDFNKTYRNEEYKRRFENFKASLKEIARLNMLENNTVFGLTKFSDMSKEEFAERILLKAIPPCEDRFRTCTNGTHPQYKPLIYKKYGYDPPRSFDWRHKRGFVKPVLNQKRCQACWAFSIVGVLETMSAIQLNDTSSRSIQELLDCSSYNSGCMGGNVVTAMDYICDFQLPFVTEEEYPLTLAMDRKCLRPSDIGRRVKQFEHKCYVDEDIMVEIIATHGPLVVAVDSSNWMNYIGGIITRACTRGVSNHVVQIVGYEGYGEPDSKTPIPYYIVRNSFGEDFGDNGYMYIAMKHGDISDVCGIAEQVTLINCVY